jgi:plasmid stability protein
MDRTTISLPPELHKRLRVLAAERGVSMAALIREAVEEKANFRPPKPKSIGMGASKYTTTARDSADFRFEPPPWRSS